MIHLKGDRGEYLINPATIELVEIGAEITVIVTAHAKVTVLTSENMDALQRLRAASIAFVEEPQVYPF